MEKLKDMETDFLNDEKTEQKSGLIVKILDIFIIILSIVCNIIVVAFDLLCSIIEGVAYVSLATTAAKTVRRRKRRH